MKDYFYLRKKRKEIILKKTTTKYYCDVCNKNTDIYDIVNKEMQVVYHTEKTEGRSIDPHLSISHVNLCQECLNIILNDGKILNMSGHMGYNKYWFNEEKISTSDTEHLKWIYGRLIRYGENERVDYMVRFKKIIDKYEEE